MTRTFIGVDSSGSACLKITLDSGDDPYSTPDAARHKFAYNSKDHKVGEIAAVKVPAQVNTGGAWVYVGGAGTSVDYEHAYRGGTNYYDSRFSAASMPDLDYFCPLVDYKFKDAAGKGADLQYLGGGSGLSASGGYDAIGGKVANALIGYATEAGAYAGPIGGDTLHYGTASGYAPQHGSPPGALTKVAINSSQLRDENFDGSTRAIVWNLPGDNAGMIQEPALTPVSGHKSIKIDPATLAIAKPGYDIDTATKQQMAFSAEKKPVKVIASGDILIAASATTTHDIGFAVNVDVYLDVQYYEPGGDIFYPAPPSVALYGAKYYVSGSTLYFENSGVACRARFIVIAVDTLSPSSGTNKVFQQFEADGEQVVRILAPGATDPPQLSDIVVDSRWPTMPILAEGYLPVTAGAQNYTVSFTNPGLKPFVKLSVLQSYTGGNIISTAPLVRRLRRPTYGMSGDTVYAKVASTDDQITISTFRGLPVNAFVTGRGLVEWYLPPVIGVRYYVFGIPT